jgi:hypothetical protein
VLKFREGGRREEGRGKREEGRGIRKTRKVREILKFRKREKIDKKFTNSGQHGDPVHEEDEVYFW